MSKDAPIIAAKFPAKVAVEEGKTIIGVGAAVLKANHFVMAHMRQPILLR